MANGTVSTSKPQTNIPTYLPLAEAAKKFGMPQKVLTQMARTGKIEAVRLPSGELLVAAENNGQSKTKKEIIVEKFPHLRKNVISASDASRKYSRLHKIPISQRSFSRWAKSGYITAESDGYRLQMNEAEVAYCAEIYAQKYHEYEGQMSGVRIFDEDGNPYKLKYPEVAEQLRIERRQTQK